MIERSSNRSHAIELSRLLDSLDLSRGCFFYPCCARDLAAPMQWFSRRVTEVHFADLWMPSLATGRFTGRHVLEHDRQLVTYPEVVPSETHRIPSRFSEIIGTEGDRHSIKLGPLNRRTQVTWHQYDAVYALGQVGTLSVFFHRSDGPAWGEGSSGIPWLQAVLLNRVLDQLADGGLIVTDGSNGHHPDEDYPWSNLWRDLRARKKEVPRGLPMCFEWSKRRFECLAALPRQGRYVTPSYLWKVSRVESA